MKIEWEYEKGEWCAYDNDGHLRATLTKQNGFWITRVDTYGRGNLKRIGDFFMLGEAKQNVNRISRIME